MKRLLIMAIIVLTAVMAMTAGCDPREELTYRQRQKQWQDNYKANGGIVVP